MSSAICYTPLKLCYCELRIVRGGTVPDIRPMTKLRNVQLCPKKGKDVNPNLSLSLLIHHPSPQLDIMGVQREPGQKGVNWSNIAVGMCTLLFTSLDSA